MAFKTTKTLNSKDGSSLPSGNVIAFDTYFKHKVNTMEVKLFVYQNEATYNTSDGKPKGQPYDEIAEYTFLHQISEQEYTSLTPATAHDIVKAKIESWDASWVGKLTVIL